MFSDYLVDWIDRMERRGYSDELIVENVLDLFDLDPDVVMDIIKNHK